MRRRAGWIVPGILIGLWLISLALPVADDQLGVWFLLLGWIGVGSLQFGWFANILLPTGVMLGRRFDPGRTELLVGSMLLVLGINTAFLSELADDGGYYPIKTFGAGYYCWMAAVMGGGFWLIWRGLTGGTRETI